MKLVKTIQFFVAVCLVCIQLSSSTEAYQKVIHNIDQSALCLDGSPAALYEHPGSEKDKFLIFFGGGGSCGGQTLNETIDNCYQRSKTYLGSSKYMLDQMRPQGILSTDPTKSKFATWTKFIFAYCDGSFHQGNRNSPVSYKDSKLYFRGSSITRAHLKYISQKYNLTAATEMVVSGVSAGAMAAFMWTNHIQTLLPNPKIVSTIIDSGVFINDTSIKTGKHKSALMTQNVYKLANLNEETPYTECNKMTVKGREWNCFFFEYAYSLIKGRVMNLISLYDSFDLKYQYEISCILEGSEGQTFTNCSAKEQNAIDQRFEKTLALNDKFMALSQDHSSWAISCSHHVYTGNWKYYNSPNQTVLSMSVKEAAQAFIFQRKRIIQIDNGKWPSNQKCAY